MADFLFFAPLLTHQTPAFSRDTIWNIHTWKDWNNDRKSMKIPAHCQLALRTFDPRCNSQAHTHQHKRTHTQIHTHTHRHTCTHRLYIRMTLKCAGGGVSMQKEKENFLPHHLKSWRIHLTHISRTHIHTHTHTHTHKHNSHTISHTETHIHRPGVGGGGGVV